MIRIILFSASTLTAIAAIRSAFQSGPTNNNTIFLTGITFAFVLYGWFFDYVKKQRWLTISIAVVCVLILGFSVFLAAYGRRTTADFNEEVILVLGGGIRDGEIRPTLQMRLDAAISYHHRNPDVPIIVTGGKGFGETISEAMAMERYLIENGVPAEIIFREDRATSTYTNMAFSRAIIDELFETTPRAVVITSNFHMYRSVRFAAMYGLEATIYPAPIPWLSTPFYHVREVAAVVKMWVIGQ